MLSKPHVLQQSLLMLLMVRLVGHSYKIPAPCQMLVVAQTKKKKTHCSAEGNYFFGEKGHIYFLLKMLCGEIKKRNSFISQKLCKK